MSIVHMFQHVWISNVFPLTVLIFNFYAPQVIQDELLSNEVEKHRASNAGSIPLPIQKYLITLSLENTANLDDKVPQRLAIKSCMRDMYHYARISGTHILECVIDAALSAVRREGLQEASDVCYMFYEESE